MYRQRHKLAHACIFFVENCAEVGRMKLYKLLYDLDFSAQHKFGRSVTGLKYFAWEKGPVPQKLDAEWKSGFQDVLAEALRPQAKGRIYDFEVENPKVYPSYKLEPRVPFDEGLFSADELALMADVTRKHFNDSGLDMSHWSHDETGFWHHIYTTLGQPGQEIPLDLVFERQNTPRDQQMKEYAHEKEIERQLSD